MSVRTLTAAGALLLLIADCAAAATLPVAAPHSQSAATLVAARAGYRTRYREYNNPDAYRTGSSRWWEEMDRQDRGGRR